MVELLSRRPDHHVPARDEEEERSDVTAGKVKRSAKQNRGNKIRERRGKKGEKVMRVGSAGNLKGKRRVRTIPPDSPVILASYITLGQLQVL